MYTEFYTHSQILHTKITCTHAHTYMQVHKHTLAFPRTWYKFTRNTISCIPGLATDWCTTKRVTRSSIRMRLKRHCVHWKRICTRRCDTFRLLTSAMHATADWHTDWGYRVPLVSHCRCVLSFDIVTAFCLWSCEVLLYLRAAWRRFHACVAVVGVYFLV